MPVKRTGYSIRSGNSAYLPQGLFFARLGRDNRLLMLALGMWGFGEGLWFNLRPIFIEQLGATPSQVGQVLALRGVAQIAFLLPVGWLADRYGPRHLILVSRILGIVSALVAGASVDWRWMIPSEFLYGASAFILPALNSYVLLALPQDADNRSMERVLSGVFASFSLGLMFSQPLGGLLAQRYGIRSTFWIATGVFAISLATMHKINHHPTPQDAMPRNWRDLMDNKAIPMLVPFIFLMAFSVTLGWPLTPIFLHNVRGLSLGWIGLLSSLFSFGTVIWNLSIGQVRPQRGLPAALGLVWLSMLILLHSGVVLAISIAYSLMGAIYTVRALINAAVARRVSPAQRGTVFGISEVCVAMGMTLAPHIAGHLYEIRPELPFQASLVSIPPIAVLSLILLSLLKPNAPDLLQEHRVT